MAGAKGWNYQGGPRADVEYSSRRGKLKTDCSDRLPGKNALRTLQCDKVER